MPDVHLVPEPSPAGTFPATEELGGWGPPERALIDRLRAELAARDREVRELRDQLRAIHNSSSWAILRTLAQARTALAPHGTRRDQWARLGLRGLRRLKKGFVRLARAPWIMSRWSTAGPARRIRIEPVAREHYAVVCLPMIEWGFRFQRPQQLMRQFALGGHLVLYAAHRFHRGAGARARAVATNILEVSLPGDPAANVYQMLPAEADRARMVAALAGLRAAWGLADAVIIAQHPYWMALAEALRERFGWPIVYDCMDDHSGFLHNSPEILASEARLIEVADLVVASSEVLLRRVEGRSRAATLVRNGCDYSHFSPSRKGKGAARTRKGPLIGYYGAIAEWFDSRLVAELAGLRPGWRFELIGSTLAGDVRPLRDAANVRLLGERAYDALPGLISEWDAFIIPFKRVALTEATNPVKVYEMLATGKPIVAVGLPELVPMARAGLIRLAGTAMEFARAIAQALEDADLSSAERRRAFARRNTWQVRHRELALAIEGTCRWRGAGRCGAGE